MARTRKIDWDKVAGETLNGRTIGSARYMSAEEATQWGWYNRGLVLFFTDGTQLVLSQDDEGNGPGAAFVSCAGKETTLPVL